MKGSKRYKGDDQVMMATKSGAMFVMTSDFNVHLYANLSYAVTNIKLLPATGAEDVDAVVSCIPLFRFIN